jgi:hypothetical protein
VLNTEYRKCHHITGQDITDPQKSTKEEDLLAMMNFVQVIVSLRKRRFCQHGRSELYTWKADFSQ